MDVKGIEALTQLLALSDQIEKQDTSKVWVRKDKRGSIKFEEKQGPLWRLIHITIPRLWSNPRDSFSLKDNYTELNKLFSKIDNYNDLKEMATRGNKDVDAMLNKLDQLKDYCNEVLRKADPNNTKKVKEIQWTRPHSTVQQEIALKSFNDELNVVRNESCQNCPKMKAALGAVELEATRRILHLEQGRKGVEPISAEEFGRYLKAYGFEKKVPESVITFIDNHFQGLSVKLGLEISPAPQKELVQEKERVAETMQEEALKKGKLAEPLPKTAQHEPEKPAKKAVTEQPMRAGARAPATEPWKIAKFKNVQREWLHFKDGLAKLLNALDLKGRLGTLEPLESSIRRISQDTSSYYEIDLADLKEDWKSKLRVDLQTYPFEKISAGAKKHLEDLFPGLLKEIEDAQKASIAQRVQAKHAKQAAEKAYLAEALAPYRDELEEFLDIKVDACTVADLTSKRGQLIMNFNKYEKDFSNDFGEITNVSHPLYGDINFKIAQHLLSSPFHNANTLQDWIKALQHAGAYMREAQIYRCKDDKDDFGIRSEKYLSLWFCGNI